MPRMISCPCSPSFRELSVANGAFFIYNLSSISFLGYRWLFAASPHLSTHLY